MNWGENYTMTKCIGCDRPSNSLICYICKDVCFYCRDTLEGDDVVYQCYNHGDNQGGQYCINCVMLCKLCNEYFCQGCLENTALCTFHVEDDICPSCLKECVLCGAHCCHLHRNHSEAGNVCTKCVSSSGCESD